MSRLRDLGVEPGRLPPGRHNAITDVPGVRVGHTTLIRGEGPLQEGVGPLRTGVTAVLPHGGNIYRDKVAAAVYSFNGYGKVMGFEQIRERGSLETPVLLTSNLSVARAGDALMSYMLRQNPDIALTTGTVNCVVGECNDGMLSDARGRHIRPEHVFAAIEGASGGPVAEGNVGGGTGTTCYQFKGGIGTASRRLPDAGYLVGALVQANHGKREELMVLGVPVGLALADEEMPRHNPGSIMIVLASDAPLDALQLTRVAKRAALGLARTGTVSHDQSGDFIIAFASATRIPHEPDDLLFQAPRLHDRSDILDSLFLATVEAVEEAILNALLAAETMTGRDGLVVPALPPDRLCELLRRHGRL